MNEVTMYGNDQCKYCNLAESLLLQKGVLSINKILVNHHDESLTAMIEVTVRKTTPQIFIGNRHIGGFDDLALLDDEGSLDTLLRT